MAKRKLRKPNKNKINRSTDRMIESAIAQQNDWKTNRRDYANRILKTLNIFARPKSEKATLNIAADAETNVVKTRSNGLRAYWFPILCAFIVIFVAIWVAFTHVRNDVRGTAAVAEPIVRTVRTSDIPTFDIVRIAPDGTITVAGRWLPHQNISIVVNGKIIATERTDSNGEFVYSPKRVFDAGNYTFSLIGADPDVKSTENVFVYISEHGYENSISLLMTTDGSTLFQAPAMLQDGDLKISKIDYLDTGRIVITGDGLPRLRVSLSLNDKYLGFARVSDHHHFGLGADVGELKSGEKYTLTIRMHDGDGRTVAQVGHTFTMPEMTGDDNTYYTVRRGDCLWIIARNFLRRGVLFSIVAERNNISNPDLIFPRQLLQIPTKQ